MNQHLKGLIQALNDGKSFKQEGINATHYKNGWVVTLKGSVIIKKVGNKVTLTLAGWNLPETRNTINAVLSGALPGTDVAHVGTKNSRPFVRLASGREVTITPLTEYVYEV